MHVLSVLRFFAQGRCFSMALDGHDSMSRYDTNKFSMQICKSIVFLFQHFNCLLYKNARLFAWTCVQRMRKVQYACMASVLAPDAAVFSIRFMLMQPQTTVIKLMRKTSSNDIWDWDRARNYDYANLPISSHKEVSCQLATTEKYDEAWLDCDSDSSQHRGHVTCTASSDAGCTSLALS